MTVEICRLCLEECVANLFNGYFICDQCLENGKKIFYPNMIIDIEDLEKIYPSINQTEAYVYPCEHQWVSVKERLPEIEEFNVSDSVLICYKTKKDENYLHCSVGFFSDIDNIEEWSLSSPLEIDYFPHDHSNQIIVTHWMPLPNAPERDK